MTRSFRPAKISPPRLARVHPRPRLFRLLDGARRKPLAWVQGPPGSGKTVLVASWIARRRLSALWVGLDASDDAAAVFGHLAAAARRACGNRIALPAFRPEHLVCPGPFARRFFGALAASRRRPDAIVLDDYHEIPPDSLLHVALADGLAEAHGIAVVVASRSDMPAAFSRLRAADAVAAVGPAALVLTPAEARAVARLRAPGGTAPPPQGIELVAGWAAGIVLLAASGAGGRAPDPGAQRALLDYVAHEIFGRADDRTRRVLLRTAPLATVDADVAVRLTGDPEAGAVLADLARRGWLTERVAGERPSYRYHALLRLFLVARAGEELGGAGLASLRREAAALVAEAGDRDAALSLLADAEAWSDLAHLLLGAAPALVAEGRAEALGRWIDRLPAALLDQVPWLGYFRGVAHFPAQPRAALEHLARAHAAFVAAGDAAGAYRSWATAVDFHFLALSDMAPLDAALGALDALRVRFPGWPDRDTEAAVVASAVCAYANRRAADPRLAGWEERALEIALAPGPPRTRMNVGRQLAIHLSFWTADLVRARLVVDALRPLAVAPDADPADAIVWHIGEANWYAHTGDGPGARAAADRGLAIAVRSGVRLWDSVLLTVRIFGALCDDDFAAAQADLGVLAAVVPHAPALTACAYHYTAGVVALRRGNLREAVEHARAAVRLGADAGHPLASAAARVTWAAAAAAAGEPGPTLDEAAAEATAAGYEYAAMGARLAAASAALARDDEEAASAALRQALPAARRLGCLNSVWTGRAELAELCALALERGIEEEQVRGLVQARALAPAGRARRLAAWPWRVRVEALGGLRVVRDGAAPRAPGSQKGQRKVIDLLRLLVAHGPPGGRAAALAEALWPAADGDRAAHALETTAYRLRKLLGDPAAIVQRDGRMAIDPLRVFVDAWALEELVARAGALRVAGQLEPARGLERAAAGLAAGDLFGDEPDPAVAFARERYRTQLKRLGIAR
jgi:hypothetical protein